MVGLIKEFKKFAMKGNVVDMAIGIFIGSAFGKIASSLVSDEIVPADRQTDRRRELFGNEVVAR